MSSLTLSYKGGHYHDISSLLSCIRASMSVPGITGSLSGIIHRENFGSNSRDPVEMLNSHSIELISSEKYDVIDQNSVELLTDALLVEPIPYRSACNDGVTHVLVLRTKPDPCTYLGPKNPVGIYEKVFLPHSHCKYR